MPCAAPDFPRDFTRHEVEAAGGPEESRAQRMSSQTSSEDRWSEARPQEGGLESRETEAAQPVVEPAPQLQETPTFAHPFLTCSFIPSPFKRNHSRLPFTYIVTLGILTLKGYTQWGRANTQAGQAPLN